ncbi:MAG: sulfatase-like hydrolase/transferase [Pirellulales bacterium]|nr:sulfatase-like hydrolase/transferase [Pirellulales bacterium]
MRVQAWRGVVAGCSMACYIVAMPTRHAICITIDGLRASALGAYGNTWHPTPALDLLASQAHVVDWMLCDRPTLEGFYASVWGGSGNFLAEQLTAAGVQAALTTDDRAIAERAEATGFADVRRIEFTAEQSAATVAETELAQLFAVAVDQLEGWARAENSPDASTARLLWLHARGFHGAWDAPLEFRDSLLDDEDPPAPEFVTPPALETVADHDTLLLHRAAYAAQTMVLDECVDALLAALVEFGLDDSTLVVLVGSLGFSLGEHGVVGGDAAGVYGELLHVPCLVRAPGAIGPPPRSSQLSLPVDLRATLLQWFGVEATGSAERGSSLLAGGGGGPSAGRQYVVATGDDGGRAIRTPAWMLIQRPSDPSQLAEHSDAGAVELYLKPDDRWEANEIADRCPEIVVELLAVLDRGLKAREAKTSGTADLRQAIVAPLDERLVAHPR